MLHRSNKEQGLALLLTVFVVSMAALIVLEVGHRSRYDLKASRVFAESVQADYILKSGLNFSRVLIELPKQIGADNSLIREDWLGEPWSLIAAAPSLPISGFDGEVRVMIVDNNGKIDLNSIVSYTGSGSSIADIYSLTSQERAGAALHDPTSFWKETLRRIFERAGFVQEKYNPKLHRTPGNVAFDSGKQVAVIHDWIDEDHKSHGSAQFDADGIESTTNRKLFFNRPLASLSEILLVPGFTLERLTKVAPYITVGPAFSRRRRRININTAPLEVLIGLGFPEGQAIEIVEQRANLPYSQAMLNVLISGDVQLKQHTKVTSTEFGIYVQVKTTNATRWMRARVKTIGVSPRRRTSVSSTEYY